MEANCGKRGLFQTLILAMAVCSLYIFPALSWADDYDFWVQTPTQWTNRTDRLGQDLKKQVMSPQEDAFIEVYAAKGNNIGVTAIADGMEQAMRGTKPYLQNRVSSRDVQADGQPAILREYNGVYNNIPLRAYALYAYGNGGAFAVYGVFVTSQSAKYQDTVYTCVTSLRFSPPGQQTIADIGGSPYGASGSGNPYDNQPQTSACDAIVGKWRWFTGSTAEFGPNGTIPGNGKNHWECLDNGTTFRISWNNGQWIDTLNLIQNGQRLEGKNQKGNTVWGTRITPATAPAAVSSPVHAGNTGGTTGNTAGACCSYIGMWDFVPPGIHRSFMPDQGRLDGGGNFTYTCSGDQVTIRWPNGETNTWQRENNNRLTRKDQWGNLVKATRVTDHVKIDGKTYTACTETPGAAATGTDIPKADKAKKISGNMGAQWGFAHGSLNPSEPSKWELATTRAVTLNFLDPYKKGQQRYTVRVLTKAGNLVSSTQVGMSGSLNLSAGTYTIEVSTDIKYAGWRCEWK